MSVKGILRAVGCIRSLVSRITPTHMVIIGSFLLVMKAVLPFLMVMQVFPSTIFLNFLSYASQVIGLFVGMYGAITIVKINRNRH